MFGTNLFSSLTITGAKLAFFSFLNAHGIIISIVITALLSLYIFIKVTRKIYKVMSDVEYGAMTLEGMAHTIEKIQRSDWDDRMVEAIARIITVLPFLRLIPTKLLSKLLYSMLQGCFNSVKGLLQAKANTLHKLNDQQKEIAVAKSNELMKQLDEILNDIKESYVDQNVVEQLKEKVSTLAKEKSELVVAEVESKIQEVNNTVTKTVSNTVTEASEDVQKSIASLFVDTGLGSIVSSQNTEETKPTSNSLDRLSSIFNTGGDE